MSTIYERAKEILDQYGQDREAAHNYVMKHLTASANAEHEEAAISLGWQDAFRKVHADTRQVPRTSSDKFVSGRVTGSVRRAVPRTSSISPARQAAIVAAAKKVEEEFVANYRLQWINVALKDATVTDIRAVRERFANVRSHADRHINWLDEIIAMFPKGDLTSTLPSQFYKRVHELHLKYLEAEGV